MTEPAFPAEYVQSGVVTVKTSGISQRRLLAGMICSGMMAGIVGMPDQQWKQEQIKIVVSVGVCIADELIKQTEQT